MAKLEKVDAVIAGAGASGSVYAAVLAKTGKKVVVLEQGPDWKLSDLISSDFWGRRIKTAGAPFLLEGRNPVGYSYQSGWGVGGAALHYFANFPRLLPNDFKVKSEHNRGLDWPISYQDLAPYFDKVARDVGVSGDARAEEIWRPAGAPYPMPPMKTFRNGDIWLKGFAAAGIRMVPAAVGMNSTDYKGRPACIYDGWCHVGCPTGALSNPLVTYLADARKAGAEVRAWSTVTRVLTNAKGTRVTGVEYYDHKKEKQFQPASVVVLAAWSAQNPRILLNSANGAHPKGLANRSGLVGKYLMTHYSSGTWALFDENVENHMGTTGAQYMSYDRYGKTSHKGAFGSSFIVAGTAMKTSDLGGFANARLDLFGPELHAFMKRAARGLTRIGAFGEEMPNIENRVELALDKDEFGMPLGRIVHSYDQDVTAVWNANFEEGLKIANAAGAKEAWSARGNIPTIHLMGGTIMGTGAGNSVVNGYGQAHEIANLFVAGPGIFPTSGASNPTYTIFALSLRGAEQLAGKWKAVVG
ncbi:MAG TPA: GMC family oxidoreductase [Burkholderiales bacterium]|nr:GMC family oxidoreductase [Burkholderiales bacterium]